MEKIAGLLLLFLYTTLVMQAQTVIIQGVVFDELGPLPNATIQIGKTGIGTVADVDGRYTIPVKESEKPIYLIFSFAGRQSKTVVWKGEQKIDVKLQNATTQIKEVVVVANPTINKIDIRSRTGSVASVDVRQLSNKPMQSIGLALQGVVPGLQIINRGELGTKPEIRIRGVSSFRRGDLPNEPLYVLDGRVISPETFFALNSQDIKDIKILKDAVATALYGIKAANGVIEITSTRGFSGARIVSYSMKTGITFRGEQSARMMKSPEKLELERLLENPATPGFRYSEKYIRKTNIGNPNIDKLIERGRAITDSLAAINTNWYDKLIRTNTYHSHTLSMRGGNNITSYYTSIGFLQQGGQLLGNDFRKFSGSVSIDQQLSRHAILGLSINGAYSHTNTPNGSKHSVYELIYQLNPYETEKSRELYSYPTKGYADLFNQYRQQTDKKILGISLYLNYNITRELNVSAAGGIDYVLDENLSVTPPTAFDEIKPGGPPVGERGVLSQSKNTETNSSTNLRLTYRKAFDKHNLVLGGNTDYYSTLYDNLNVRGHGLIGPARSAAAIDNSIDGKNRASVGGKRMLRREVGVGVLAGYTYDNTYDLFGTYKFDASSVLPKDKRYNNAWALGAGIDLKQYPFMKQYTWLHSLKLRGSYGYTASLQGVLPEIRIATFEYMPSGYNHVRGFRLMALPNKDLQAEKNHILDYGIRSTIGKTSIDLSLYRRTTFNALLEVPIASSNGFSTQWQNVGVMENSGVEASISQQLFHFNKYSLRIRINFAYNKNKVVSLYEGDRLYTSPHAVFPDYEVGQSTDALYGLQSQGINPLTGVPTYRKHDGSEASVYANFRREDFVPLGYSTPPINGGVQYWFTYKNMELDLDFYYTLGGKRTYQLSYVRKWSNVIYNAVEGQVKDMWFKEGDENKRYPSPFVLSLGYQNLNYPSARTIGSTDMIRLNGVSLLYRLPHPVLKSFRGFLQSLTCGIQGSNLFMLKRFSESDPESGCIVAPLQPVLTFSLNASL